ncbi:MAG: branched-chain amino acid:cation transporter, family [Candidatus Dependentiae bacterium]|nr:branched-chain amino acid:cation transporter, family [Candidatus Dependentiae bacterium]
MSSPIPTQLRHIFTTGLAMFSMFFGAGNVVFPLIVGQMAGDQAWVAIIGLLITAVGVPFLGLLAMVLYEGDYHAFFARIGRIPGFLVTLFIMILIGPFGATPRCIAFAYSTLKMYDATLSTVLFSFISCIVIYLATYKKSRITDLLGTVLSPLLVLSLVVIIIKGILCHPTSPHSAFDAAEMFKFGLLEGYNTMDLLGTFFFSGVIIAGLRQIGGEINSDKRLLARYALQASIIGATLLGLVYAGFVLVASYYGSALATVPAEVLLGTIAHMVLGQIGGIFVSLAVVLACLTTALALAAVFAEFLHNQLFFKVVCYRSSLVLTLLTTFIFANLKFTEIVAMLIPILIVIYPVLLVLTIMNILHKLYGVSMVKTPVVLATIASIIWYHVPEVLAHIGVAI